jgi:hypothetical protein
MTVKKVPPQRCVSRKEIQSAVTGQGKVSVESEILGRLSAAYRASGPDGFIDRLREEYPHLKDRSR